MVEQDPAIPPAPLAIYTDFQQDAPKAVLDEMRAEAEAILAPAGLRFEWRPLAGFRPDIVSAAVVVAHFHDRCDAAGLVMRGNRPGSLAWTDMSDGRPLPFIHVDCGRVRTFLQTALLGHRLQDRISSTVARSAASSPPSSVTPSPPARTTPPAVSPGKTTWSRISSHPPFAWNPARSRSFAPVALWKASAPPRRADSPPSAIMARDEPP